MSRPVLEPTGRGLYCPAGEFYIDPWQPVRRAIVTHAHGDHARRGSERYLAAAEGIGVMRHRLGADAHIEAMPYGESRLINGVRVSLHPAGHILGSAQVRVELGGEVWVVSGDYKREPDPTCAPFEVVPCHTFISEATFGLPIYRWPPQEEIFTEINSWWRQNRAEGQGSILFAYALGKAQRLLMGIDATIGPIYVHGAVHNLNDIYRASGIGLPDARYVGEAAPKQDWSRALIVAPPSAQNSPWLRRFGRASTAFASGWMRVRGQRRRRSVDRGFVLSDHVDWPGIIRTIAETGAQRVYVTHGYTPPLVRWLTEQGVEAYALETPYQGEADEQGE